MSEQKYHIHTVSSESEQSRAFGLCEGTGWVSAPLPTYPQELTIHFFTPIQLKTLRLVFHHYKIPRFMELFVRNAKNDIYKKIGYVAPNDNQQSAFESKEIKKLFLQHPCKYLKLLIHEPYQNEFNILKQVAIDQLSVIGTVLSFTEIASLEVMQAGEISSEDQQVPVSEVHIQDSKIQFSSLAKPTEIGIDSTKHILREDGTEDIQLSEINAYLKEMEQKKLAAKANQDFDEASRCKKIIDALSSAKNRYYDFEAQKAEALKREDYDTCKNLKIKINEIRNGLTSEFNRFKSHPKAAAAPILDEDRPIPSLDRVNQAAEGRQYMQASRQITPMRENVALAQPAAAMIVSRNMQSSHIDHENQVVPAQRKDKKQEAVEDRITDTMTKERKSPEKKLEQNFRMKLENYFSIVSEDIWCYLMNKDWRNKSMGLIKVNNCMESIRNKEEYLCGLEVVALTIVDSNPSIVQGALNLLRRVIDSRVIFTLNQLPFIIENILQALISHLTNINGKIRDEVYKLYLDLANITFLPFGIVINRLVRYKQGNKLDPKINTIRLKLIEDFLQIYLDARDHYKEIAKWLITFLEDPDTKKQSKAYSLLTELCASGLEDGILQLVRELKPHLVSNFSQNAERSNLNNSLLHNASSASKAGVLGSKAKSLEKSDLSINQSSLSRERSPQQDKKDRHSQESSQINHSGFGQDRNKNIIGGANTSKMVQKSSFEDSISNDISKVPHNNRGQPESQEDAGDSITEHSFEDDEKQDDLPEDECYYCMQKGLSDCQTHMLHFCPSLFPCEDCIELQYIRYATKHLVSDCPNKHSALCSRCGIAFDYNVINAHIAQGSCKRKRGKQYERCQFCAKDIIADDTKWVEHALVCDQKPKRKIR